MGEARKAISFALTNTLEWGTPVLYSRASDGRLFMVSSISSATGVQSLTEPTGQLSAEQEPFGRAAERGASERNAGAQRVGANLPGRSEEQQKKVPFVAPARQVANVRYGIAKMAAPASRWRQPGLWATLFVIALLVGTLSFRSQLAGMFGLRPTGVLPATTTVVATTSTPNTVVALLPSATLTPTSTIDSAATAAAVTAEAAATATIIAHQLVTNESATLTALSTVTLTSPPLPTPTPTATTTPTPLPTATATPTPRPADGDKFTLDAFAMTFAYVSAGPFTMGSPSGEGSDDEHPQHEMPVDAFWIGLTEVTNVQYQHFIDAKGYDNQEWWTDAGWQWRTENKIDGPAYWAAEKWNGANQPVVGVSWYEAIAYATWLAAETGLTIDLPTEAQWEKAARGTDDRKYPWGNDWDGKRLNYCDSHCDQGWKDNAVDDGFAYTAPVGNYPNGASPYGALDMAGNVWEWTATKWVANYENYSNVADNDKEGDTTRTLRGGSWSLNSLNVRSALRDWYNLYGRNLNLGFRLVFAPGS